MSNKTSTYYNNPDQNYPYVQLAVLQALRYHICTALYPNEEFETSSKNRFLMADFQAGTEHAIRKSIEQFKTIMGNFPFTAYQIGDTTLEEQYNTHYERSGLYYSPYFEKYVRSFPVEFEVPMMSFFTQPSDYHHAMTILYGLNTVLQRLIVPVTVNGVLDSFGANVVLEVEKGDLAFQLEEQKDKGKIYDIRHNAKIKMHYFIIPDVVISPVDDFSIAMNNLPDTGYQSSNTVYGIIELSEQPVVTSIPENNATGVSINSNIIFNFNVSMHEDKVENAISFYPDISAEYVWNTDSTQLTMELASPLSLNTTYEIIIDKSATSLYSNSLDSDYKIIFSTATA